MSKRRAAILGLIFVCLATLYWVFHRHQTDAVLPNDSVAPAQQVPGDTNQLVTPFQAAHALASNLVNRVTPKSKESESRSGLQSLNHVPIEYFGIVVDQKGNALPQTRVKFSIAFNDGLREGHKNGEAVADSQGRFSIRGQSGKSLSVIPERPGYTFIATNGGGMYSHLWPREQRHIPDSNKPEVLTMWKQSDGEQLIKVVKNIRFRPADSEIHLDLLRGELTQDRGDIAISLERPVGNVSTKEPAKWAVVFTPTDGEIQQATDFSFQWVYEAPTGGYQGNLRIEKLPGDRKWSTYVGVGLFIISRHGKIHSKVSIGLHLNEEENAPCVLRITSLTNPNGSRNWEETPGRVTMIGP